MYYKKIIFVGQVNPTKKNKNNFRINSRGGGMASAVEKRGRRYREDEKRIRRD
jgi:hypothetical protein